ncbi:hypothetical protein ACVIIW_006242 [Bradyrhizobium sp. USDA 4449]
MSNNTLHAFRDAQAASDYLAADELYEEYAQIYNDAVVETTARALRGFGWARAGSLSVSSSTCTHTLAKPARGFARYFSSVGTEQLLIIDQKDEKPSLIAAETVADRVVRELGRIKDDWAGPGTVAPSKRVLSDVEAVAMRLPSNLKMPAIDVDEEDGSVAIRWVAENRSRSFSLVFRGNGKVSGVLATIEPPRSSSWSLGVGEEIKIALKLEDSLVRQLIAS